MNCEILRTLYLRSNGEIPCNCAAGERINLGWSFDEEGWDVSKVFSNENYAMIRTSFKEDKAPWGRICESCAFFMPAAPIDDQIGINRWIEKFHIEPALTCGLRCPGCSRIEQIKRRRPPFVLSEDVFGKTLSSLVRNDFRVGFFYYCGQGEPLNHPRFQKLAIMAHEAYPGVRQVVNTNGNHFVREVFDGSKYVPDEFIVSVDGLDQQSYEKYRVNGDVGLALRFMKDLKSLPNPPLVEWKYILFTYNDTDDEIQRAQERALDLGVDRVMFVLTHTKERSRRFTIDNIDELNLVPGLGYHVMTPHLYHRKDAARLVSLRQCCDLQDTKLLVDSVARTSAGLAMFQATLESSLFDVFERLEVRINGDFMGGVDFLRENVVRRKFTLSLSRKGMDLGLDTYYFVCVLFGKENRELGSWSFEFSFSETIIHKHTTKAV